LRGRGVIAIQLDSSAFCERCSDATVDLNKPTRYYFVAVVDSSLFATRADMEYTVLSYVNCVKSTEDVG